MTQRGHRHRSRESLLAALAKGREALRQKREAAKAGVLVRESRPQPFIGREAARELIPRMLADEIAWRSGLLALLSDMRSHLLAAVKDKAFSESRTTLPQIIREVRSLIREEREMLAETKSIVPEAGGEKQVVGLVARHALLRRQLIERGLMDKETGQLKLPPNAAQRVEQSAETPNGKDSESGDIGSSTGPDSE